MAEKEEEEDRMSSLPDDVLSHILSFLELREAVKTLILSKRWEKVWTLIHRIYLNNDSFEEIMKETSSFNNFADWVLIGNKISSVIKSFCLWYLFGPNLDEEILYVMEWINAAISPNLENFELRFGLFCFYPTICIQMPRALFQCPKLVTLKLESINYTMMSLDVSETTVCLPSLVKLHLHDLLLQDDNSLKNLLLGCPLLEELHMTDIENGFGEQNNLFLLSPSLKVLRVKHGVHCYRFGNRYVVQAPKLEHLHFVEWSLSGLTVTASSPYLVSAFIKICTCKRDPNPLPVIDFFQGICGVRNLELWTEKTIMLKDELANLPKLHNLIRLKIGRCKNNGDIVSCILQHSPRLKHLILPEEFFISKKGFVWSQPERVPECLALHLETIEIGMIYSYEEEVLKMIEYLLDNGKVLKKMDLTSIRNKKVLDGLPKSDARLYFAKE